MTTNKEVLTYIKNKWPATIIDKGKSAGLGIPFPYTAPCAVEDGHFQDLYYWDTYFASYGLIRQGFLEQAQNNCDNFIYLIEKYGFIPNANTKRCLTRSQLPVFGSFVEMIFEHNNDIKWRRRAVSALEKEMKFWMEERMSPNGLNRSGYNISREKKDEFLIEMYDWLHSRRGLPKDAKKEFKLIQGGHAIAEAEVWDFTPRFNNCVMDYNPIDLNSLLYKNEVLLANFHKDLGNKKESEQWLNKSLKRKKLINDYCWNKERGAFLDYNYKTKNHSLILSAASLMPLYVGLATKKQAEMTVAVIEKELEFDYGLSTCEKNDSGIIYQWDYPNLWPPLQMIAIDSFGRYGYKKQARRIAQKYIAAVTKTFKATGRIWEKYNVLDGSIKTKNEYKLPPMMGWTAAAFIKAYDYLEKDCLSR